MNLKDNPVFWLGMRTRWRGFRLWWLPLIAAVANLALLVLFLLVLPYASGWFQGMLSLGGVGSSAPQLAWLYFFSFSSGLAGYAVMLIVPALTATTISRETEAKTFDMLVTTRLSPGTIVWGKFFSGVYPILIGMAISVAFGLLAVVWGRLPIFSSLMTYADHLAGLLAVGLMGIVASALLGRTAPSVVLAYVGSLILIPLLRTAAALPALGWYVLQMSEGLTHSGPFSGTVDPVTLSSSPPLMTMVALRILVSLNIAAGAWYAAVVWLPPPWRRRPVKEPLADPSAPDQEE